MELSTILERALALLWRASWQASVLVLIVILAQILLGKRLPPQWRHALWLLVVVRLLMPVTPSSPWSLFNYWNVKPSNILEAQTATPGTPIDTATELSLVEGTVPAMPIPETSIEQSKQGPPKQTLGYPSRSLPESALLFIKPHLGWIWFIGALILSMRLAWGNYLFGLQLRRRRPIADEKVLSLMDECREVIDVCRPLMLVEAPELESPALFGCFRLKLLLPTTIIQNFSNEELRHVFLHELAHIRRGDAAMNWLSTILLTMHWFNPVVWFAFRRMRSDRELACDAMVLAYTHDGERKPYGKTVIKVLEGFTKATAIPGLVGILEEKHEIKRRIRMITQFKKTSPWSIQALVLIIALSFISLTDGENSKVAKYSPEESQIAKKGKEPVFVTSSLDDTSGASLSLKKLMDLPYEFFRSQDISSDGRFLLGTLRGPRLGDGPQAVLELATGRIQELTIPKMSTLKFSPDGKQIAFWKGRSLQLAEVGTNKVRPLYQSDDREIGFVQAWSYDQTKILARLDKTDQSQRLVVISVVDGKLHEFKDFENNAYPSGFFSPDGNWIAYGFWNTQEPKKWQREIRLASLDGSNDISFLDPASNNSLIGWPRFGDHILFTSERRGTPDLFGIRVKDGETEGSPVLLKERIGGIRSVGFTETGALVYETDIRSADVYYAPLDKLTGKVMVTPTRATRFEGRSEFPAWSYDGRLLASISYLEGSDFPSIHIRDVESGTFRDLQTDAGYISFPRWSPDGRTIFALGLKDGGARTFAYRIDAESGKSTVIAEQLYVFINTWPAWSWTSDSKSFFNNNGFSGFTTRYDVATGATNQISMPSSHSHTVSPDGKHFGFSVTEENNNSFVRTINVVNVSGEDSRVLCELAGSEALENLLPDVGMAWTQDSKHVVFVKGKAEDPRARSLWRVSVMDGVQENLGLEMEELRQPTISPDGQHIAFTAGGTKSEVWVMENFLPKDHAAVK